MIKYPNSRNEKLMSKMLVTKRRHLYAPNWNPDDKSTSIPSIPSMLLIDVRE